MFKLRPYQEECLCAIGDNINAGNRLQVIVLATGLGKTVIFSHLPHGVKKAGKKTLILAHREELLEQAKNKIEAISPDLRIGIEQGKNIADHTEDDVIIASVATLGRKDSERIQRFNPEEFGLIIIDECHHAVASTYQNILEYFGANKQKGLVGKHPVVLGVTATPNRADNEGLDQIFDLKTFEFNIIDGVKAGYLAKIKAYSIFTDVSLKDVKTRAGDFAIDQLSDAVNNPKRNELVVDSYEEYLGDERGLVFAVDVQHAKDLCETFQMRGHKAEYITGMTDKDERKNILKRFSEGDLRVLVNINTLTEGFDEPKIRGVLMARPTKSGPLYNQMIGRGTRLSKGKSHVKILDFVDNTKTNQVVTASSIISIKQPVNFKGEDIIENAEELQYIDKFKDLSKLDLSDLDTIVKEVDILSLGNFDDEVKNYSSYSWFPFKNGYKISLGSGEGYKLYGEIQEDTLGKWETSFYELQEMGRDRFNRVHYDKLILKDSYNKTSQIDFAFSFADQYIQDRYSDKIKLVNQDAKWRGESVTDSQRKWLKKKGKYTDSQIDMLTKGQASNILNKLFGEK